MPRNALVFRPATASASGTLEVHPDFAPRLAALGIDTVAGFLDLSGEVVSGHPDRHVVRVELPGFPTAIYLKRQHAVGWRERLRNCFAGFGAVSRCEREAAILKQLAACGLPCPRWAAFGSDDGGRAFLLVEEVAATELRQVLSDNALSLNHHPLAASLGRLIARLHAEGFTTPDLTAKHVLVSRDTGEITLIDWQSAKRVRTVPAAERLRALATLHATVAEELATPRERLRVLRAALAPARHAGLVTGTFSDLARQVMAEANRLRDRRSLRDQRQPVITPAAQRLVWVAGEAVCAVPDAAAVWPVPAIGAPFYGCEPGTLPVCLPDGRDGVLIRGRSFAPVARLTAWLRGRPWRSPGVTLGRVLFHLERYGIPAPRLLAFGQRFTGPVSAEWFALHTPATEAREDCSAEVLGRRLRQLHDSGCRVVGEPRTVFASDGSIRDVTALRLSRRLSRRDREHDLTRLLASLEPTARVAAEAGYRADPVFAASRSLPVTVA